jgi:protein gp37
VADSSNIEWTDSTWNPIRGCSRISTGCEHCYAEATARRFAGPGGPYEGLLRLDPQGKPKAQWNGNVRRVPEHITDPLRWRKPRRIFVNSMSDLFHESLSYLEIAGFFGIMAGAPHHEFQVLTKRALRLASFQSWLAHQADLRTQAPEEVLRQCATTLMGATTPRDFKVRSLSHVLVGVSVEDQNAYDLRAPSLASVTHLLGARRFISYEPALGPIDFGFAHRPNLPHWVIVGGESGPNARPFSVQWAEWAILACDRARVPVFVKQMGANSNVVTEHPKGADMADWPEHVRRRDWPVRR